MSLESELLHTGLERVRARLKKDNRQLLYLALSGSHLWGLNRPDSDIDLKGIYQDPTDKVLSLHKGKDTVEFTDGIYDVQLYEIEKFLRMLCKHNGNMVNLLWTPNPISVTFLPWVGLARSFLTKRLRHYYRGYAEAQRKRAMSQRGGKALIYAYREIFSGLYTMYYRKVEYNFMNLWNTALSNKWYKGGLLQRYFPNPKQEVTDEGWHQFYSEWEDLCQVLDYETDHSELPDDYDGYDICNSLLLELRGRG